MKRSAPVADGHDSAPQAPRPTLLVGHRDPLPLLEAAPSALREVDPGVSG